jgi:TRAP transporter 4TM/12TM fusion protein
LIIGLDIGRRVIGWALTAVSIALILYAVLGRYIPGPFGHRGFNLAAIVNQVYAGLEGYYGLPARMMILYVAPFILLGAFLETTGAGDFFIKLAFALTRKSTGGPAKAAVIGSAFMGSISGSAIANVTSTGVITIPMMKKIGYRPYIAAATEAAASTGGQIMPPIMGAVAFIMVELTQIPYFTIVAVATAPIILYFITVFMFVHFEAKKQKIGVDTDRSVQPVRTVLKEGWYFFLVIVVVVAVLAFGYAPNLAALGGIIALLIIHFIKSRRINVKLVYDSLVRGGKYSLSIGSLVACIGIILAMVGLTGVGLKLSWLFSTLSGGIPFVAILMVGVVSLILGMGLASGPAYIVTAVAVGPALLEMGFPILIAHFIMIWFSIDSEITPPVGLASIVGAGIAGANPMKTMFTAFKYAKGLYILPFIFYYRPAILMQGSLVQIISTIASVLLGLIAFAAFWENYLFKKTNVLERCGLLPAAAGLLWPDWRLNAAGLVILVVIVISQQVSMLHSRVKIQASIEKERG